MYSDRFNQIISFTLANEGGYVDNPNDAGGVTNFGLSQRTYPNLDMRMLTKDQAIAIYYHDFWIKHPYDQINDYNICRKLFDESVNMGHAEAAKLLQHAVGGITVDGFLGPQSLAAINAADPTSLLSAYQLQIANFYQSLIISHPNYKEFLVGWLRRDYL